MKTTVLLTDHQWKYLKQQSIEKRLTLSSLIRNLIDKEMGGAISHNEPLKGRILGRIKSNMPFEV